MGKVDRWMKNNRTRLSAALVVGFIILSKPTPITLYLGAIPILIGQSMRIWSSGHIRKNQVLTVTGPYSLSRNPLYVGSFILGTGFMITLGVFWLALPFLLFFMLVYRYTIRWEEDKLAGAFPDEWVEYADRVPRFAAVFRWPAYRPGDFDWSQVIRYREHWNASVVLLVYFILWGKALLMGS